MIIIQIVFWVIFMYGLLSLIQDIVTEFTYKKYNKHIKVYVCVDDLKNQIENIEREISRVKWQFKNIGISIVDMDESIENEVLNENLLFQNIQVYSKKEFYSKLNNL